MNDQRKSRIAKQILPRKAMAHGVVVLDENLWGLESALREANIVVVKLLPGENYREVKKRLLPHRIFVTNSSVDFFIDDATVYEYGIVALDKLEFIDTAPTYEQNKTVQLLSKALSQFGLWTKGAKFLLELHDNGNHVLEELS